MASIKQNKLTPLLMVIGLVVVVVVAYLALHRSSGAPMKWTPTIGTPAATTAKTNAPDADSPAETLRTLTAEVNGLKSATQHLTDENSRMRVENNALKNNENEIVERVRATLVAENARIGQPVQAASPMQPGQPVPGMPANVDSVTRGGTAGAHTLGAGLGSGIPAGLGFDNTTPAPTGLNGAAIAPAPGRRTYVKMVPLGMTEAKGASGQTGLIRAEPELAQPTTDTAGLTQPVADASATPARKKIKPFFTIPENATLTGVTAMTAIVGRVPVDGRVQDPMQFKLLIGRENLAANGQHVPDDVAGVIVTGTAIGDMTLLCNEGLIQSLTFIFNDGTIQTVSRRHDGASPVLTGGASSGSAGGGNSGVATASKLGYISDDHGNPCITGKFVTNAPSYLTDMVGLKTLSLAASSLAQAQTTTVANGSGIASGVTGNKGTFVMGQAAGGAVDEVTTWIMRRLNNSFDAVVTPAGAHVAVHIDQEIRLDKDPNSRRLDYGRVNAFNTSHVEGTHHGLE